MGKAKAKKAETEDESGQGADLSSGMVASNDSEHSDGDNPPMASLTDIKKLLAGMEEWIITSLTAQITEKPHSHRQT